MTAEQKQQRPADPHRDEARFIALQEAYEKIRSKYGLSVSELISRIEGKTTIPCSIFSKGLSPLETIVKYMRENLELKSTEVASILNRSQKTTSQAYASAKKKASRMLEPDRDPEPVPVDIFGERRYSILEALVMHMKDSGMRFSEIARALNKDQRTIWTVYSRAKKK